MTDGIVNVNKPLGITSHDVVYRLRRILNIKKIGHTGTLDPDASGVLPMCVGKGTKMAEYLTAANKQYLAKLQLGAFTDTQDASGEVLEDFEVNVTEEQVREAIMGFVGEITQIPPMYSAIKIDGKKLYELAREGKTVEREPRLVTIHGIEIQNIDLTNNTVDMLVDCSKGTYIRTLCNDIGAALGCGGHMSALHRTKSGRYSIEDAFTLEQIEQMASEGNFEFMTPVGEALLEYKKIVLAERNAYRVRNGMKIRVAGLCNGETYRVFDEKNEFLALACQEDDNFVILKSFYGGA
ncbi:MAG: tRNA pseudouridine(55) synthase TruB [Clostridia bacterium]|nr:tRNA pseudouridine(55) synthase TruB [Clostridia bacterium]